MRSYRVLLLIAAVFLASFTSATYSATYDASRQQYSASGTYTLGALSASGDNLTFTAQGQYALTNMESALSSVKYVISGSSPYVFKQPNDEWHNCSYKYRLPVLVEVSQSVGRGYIEFNITDPDFLGNLSNGNEVSIYLDDNSTKLGFTIGVFGSGFITYNVSFSSLSGGFHYFYFYYGGPASAEADLSGYSIMQGYVEAMSYGSTQNQPSSCLETTTTTTTTSNYYSGGGGAPAPQPAPAPLSWGETDDSPDETVPSNAGTIVIPFVGTVTIPKFGWVVASRSSGRFALLVLGLLGLLLVYMSVKPYGGGRGGRRRR